MRTSNTRLREGRDAPIAIDLDSEDDDDDIEPQFGSMVVVPILGSAVVPDPPLVDHDETTSVLQIPSQPTRGAFWGETMIHLKTRDMADNPHGGNDEEELHAPPVSAGFRPVRVREPSGGILRSSTLDRDTRQRVARDPSTTGGASNRSDPESRHEIIPRSTASSSTASASRRRVKAEEYAAGGHVASCHTTSSTDLPNTISPIARSPPREMPPSDDTRRRMSQSSRMNDSNHNNADLVAGQLPGAIQMNTPASFRVPRQHYDARRHQEQPLMPHDASAEEEGSSSKPEDDASSKPPNAEDFLAVATLVPDKEESTDTGFQLGMDRRALTIAVSMCCFVFVAIVVVVVLVVLMIGYNRDENPASFVPPEPMPIVPTLPTSTTPVQPNTPTQDPLTMTETPATSQPTEPLTAAPLPSNAPSAVPIAVPSYVPSFAPSIAPSSQLSSAPSVVPTFAPTTEPPTLEPTPEPTLPPTTAAPFTPTPLPTAQASFPENLPDFTLEALADPASPQSRGLSWLELYPGYRTTMLDWEKQQLFAFASFYYSYNGEDWIGDHNWLSRTVPICDWGSGSRRNRCNDDGRITYFALAFQDEMLRGTTPPEVALLTSLQAFEMVSNNWNTDILQVLPSEMAQLTDLTEVKLMYSEISGTLPTGLSDFQYLTNLNLRENYLTGTIPTELGLLSNLKYLVLHGNYLTGTIPSEIASMTSLENLSLWANNLSGTLPAAVCTLPVLGTLRLDCNYKISCPVECTNCVCQDDRGETRPPRPRPASSAQAPSTSSPGPSPTPAFVSLNLGFDPALNDPEWPGVYPTPVNSTNAITINIRTDEYAHETEWEWSKLNVDDEWETIDAGNPLLDEHVHSYEKNLDSSASYRLTIKDLLSDGTCCGFGFGWFTITNATVAQEDSPGTVMWALAGDELASRVDVHLYVDSNGRAEVLEHTFTDGPTDAPMFANFDPSVDDDEWPGFFPSPINAVNIIALNVRTDRWPLETEWEWSQMTSSGDWQMIDSGTPNLEEHVYSYEKGVDSDRAYRFTVRDLLSDGTCCNFGLGWFTITNATVSTQEDSLGTVMWNLTGDDFEDEFSVHLWVDSEGRASIVEYQLILPWQRGPVDSQTTAP